MAPERTSDAPGGQLPVAPHGQRAQARRDGHAGQHRQPFGGSHLAQRQVHPATGKGTQRVGPVVTEGLRDFVAHHVAQHAAKDAGGHAHHHGHQRGHAQGAGQVGAHGGKQAQADGVGPLHGALGGLDVVLAHEHHGRQRQRQNAPDKFNVPHPEKGALVQQHIAQRAAAKRGQKTHHAHAHHIQPLARRHDDPREGKSRSGNELQHQPQRIDQGGTQNFHGAMVACW